MCETDNTKSSWPDLYKHIFFTTLELKQILDAYIANCTDNSKPFLMYMVKECIIGDKFVPTKIHTLEEILAYYYRSLILGLGCEYSYPIRELEPNYCDLKADEPLSPYHYWYDEDVIERAEEYVEENYPEEVNAHLLHFPDPLNVQNRQQLFCLSDCMLMLQTFARDVACELALHCNMPVSEQENILRSYKKTARQLKIQLAEAVYNIPFIQEHETETGATDKFFFPKQSKLDQFVTPICTDDASLPLTKLYFAKRAAYKLYGEDDSTVLPDYQKIFGVLCGRMDSVLQSPAPDTGSIREVLSLPYPVDLWERNFTDSIEIDPEETNRLFHELLHEEGLDDGDTQSLMTYKCFTEGLCEQEKSDSETVTLCDICDQFHNIYRKFGHDTGILIPQFHLHAGFCRKRIKENLEKLKEVFDLGTKSNPSHFMWFLFKNIIEKYNDGNIRYNNHKDVQLFKNEDTFQFFCKNFNSSFKASFFKKDALQYIIATFYRNIIEINNKNLQEVIKQTENNCFKIDFKKLAQLSDFPAEFLYSYGDFPHGRRNKSNYGNQYIFHPLFLLNFDNPFGGKYIGDPMPGIFIFRLMLLYLLHLSYTDDGTVDRIMSCLAMHFIYPDL